MNTEPKLIARPRRISSSTTRTTPTRPTSSFKKSGTPTRPLTHRHADPVTMSTSVSMEEAEEGSKAFKSRATEIAQFKVVSRVRPFIAEELAEMEGQERRSIVEMTNKKTVILDPKDDWAPKAQFEFDHSLWSIPPEHGIVHTFQDTKHSSYSTQRDVYDIVAKDLVPHVFDGFNSCVLSYGQTGSGKTYTMMGIYHNTVPFGGDGEEGIIPRVSHDLFSILAQKQQEEQQKSVDDRISFRVEVSFVEIYMERVRDLLDPALKNSKGSERLQDARIRQDPYSGPFVEGVTKYQVENWAQCCTLLERGSQHRTTCATAVHNQSSRSHAIFQVTVLQETTIPAKDRYSRPTKRTQAGRINLVDLAGSERGGFQDYVKESAAINKSLLALRRVIDNLTERQNLLMEQARAEITGSYFQERQLPQVPFRDSVLTWLLSDSIGGNARTTMVATLSPLVKNYGDTIATLQWSSKARNLVTLVKVNDAQTTVTGGMTNQAGELNQQVSIQRQNVDNLRDALLNKQQQAEKLEREAKEKGRLAVRRQEKAKEIHKDRSAIVLQRVFRRLVFKRRLQEHDAEHARYRAALWEKGQSVEQVMRSKEEAEARHTKTSADLKQAKSRTEKLHRQMGEVEAEHAEVTREHQETEARYNAQMKACGADVLIRQRVGDLDEACAGEERELQRLQQHTVKQRAHREEMDAALIRSEQSGWKEKCERDEGEVAALRQKRDEVARRHQEVMAEYQQVKAKYDKVFKKRR